MWRLNVGQARPPRRPLPPLDLIQPKDDLLEFDDSITALEARYSEVSVTDLIATGYYPRPIDFASTVPAPSIESLECASERSFIRAQSRTEFDKRVMKMRESPLPPIIVIQDVNKTNAENSENKLSEITMTEATELTDSEL